MATKSAWCSRWVNQEGAGGISCPTCGARFPIDISFDNAPRWCVDCRKELREWNFFYLILVIDPEAAPPLVRCILDFISRMADYESEEVMTELFQLLDRKSRSPVALVAEPQWCSRWVVAEREGGVNCPACGGRFPLEGSFDHSQRECPSCATKLVAWNFSSLVLLIDPRHAPPLLQHMIDFLRPLDTIQAGAAITELDQLLDRKTTTVGAIREQSSDRRVVEKRAS